MKNVIILFIALMLCSTILNAQSISNQVIASAGTFASADGYSLSYTIGEPATTTLINGSSIITQGFQQPNDFYHTTSGLQVIDKPLLNAQLYPNPAATEINLAINTTNRGIYTIELVDLLGHILLQPLTTQVANGVSHYVFNVRQLPSSIYFIMIKNHANTAIYSFKFNKIN